MSRPFFSIIVVSYNAESSIKKTIDSVLCQSFTNYEIVVKDAKSPDNTLKMIPEDARIKVYSEKDSGIYDGMNQAIAKATGLFLCFLNCGDTFFSPNVLKDVYNKCLKEHDVGDVVAYGNYETRGHFAKQPDVLSKNYLARRPLCHQTVFFGAKLLADRQYDTQYRILADYDLTLYLFMQGVQFKHIDATTCEYEGGGFSAKAENRQKLDCEYKAVRSRYYSKKELYIQKLKSVVTAQKVRIYLASDRAPKPLRNLYIKLANRLNQ